MIKDTEILELYCQIDEFYKEFIRCLNEHSIVSTIKKRNRAFRLSQSEVMTIMVLYHRSGMDCLKHFYLDQVCINMKHYFPTLVSYNRFVELQSMVALPLSLLLKKQLFGQCSGITFIDSTPLRVCRNQRIHSHKTFKNLAGRGHSSMGYFYGFKLHFVHNEVGQIIDFQVTPGNVHDTKPLMTRSFLKKIYGKLFGDKGYIIKAEMFELLFGKGIQVITRLRKNMKSKSLTSLQDCLLLRKRAITETIIDQLKNISKIEHSRHRSFTNFFVNLVAGLAAYQLKEKKPSIKINYTDTKQLYIC